MSKRLYNDVQIGENFRTASKKVSKEDIIAFATEYDPQPMHLSDEGGKNSLFGELVASGWQTFTLTMRLVVDSKPLGETPLVGMKVEDVHLKKPLKPNDEIYATCEVVAKRESKTKPNMGYVSVKTQTFTIDNALLASQVWVIVVPKA